MKSNRNQNRVKRHKRVRSKISGTVEIPRISVFKSNRHIFAQLIDDKQGKTLASASDIVAKTEKSMSGSKSVKTEQIAIALAAKAKQAGITKVVFDRGGYRYQGRVKVLADGLRKEGLIF